MLFHNHEIMGIAEQVKLETLTELRVVKIGDVDHGQTRVVIAGDLATRVTVKASVHDLVVDEQELIVLRGPALMRIADALHIDRRYDFDVVLVGDVQDYKKPAKASMVGITSPVGELEIALA